MQGLPGIFSDIPREKDNRRSSFAVQAGSCVSDQQYRKRGIRRTCALMVIWITGLSGAGKTTLCAALYRLLKPRLPELVLLDGDAIRSAFGADLGYKEADRQVQVKRLQNLAKVLSDQGLVVLVAVLYAHPALLDWNRHNIRDYFEIYLKASLDTLRRRDSKGWYQKATRGEASNVVGIDIPWYAPPSPDLVVDVDHPESPEVLARRVAMSVSRLARLLEKI